QACASQTSSRSPRPLTTQSLSRFAYFLWLAGMETRPCESSCWTSAPLTRSRKNAMCVSRRLAFGRTLRTSASNSSSGKTERGLVNHPHTTTPPSRPGLNLAGMVSLPLSSSLGRCAPYTTKAGSRPESACSGSHTRHLLGQALPPLAVANGEVGNHRRAPCAPHCTPLRPTNKVCSPLLPPAAYLCSSDGANHSGSRPGYSVSAADTGGSEIPESTSTGQK